MHRPKNLGTIILFLLISSIGSVLGNNGQQDGRGIIFPRGVTVNVGQVGWMIGSAHGDMGGPWRAGIRRDFDVRDYVPIVEVGKELGIRFMTLFILGELDRLNILGEYPTSNPAGKDWDNSANIGPVQLEIMNYVKANAANMEFGITGVLHEYWEEGVRSRAEWYNVEEQKPRDEKIIRNNVDLIKRLMAQYGLTPENGHSFPESFIAYGFYFNPGGEYSLGRVLSENGVKYANTPYATIEGLKHPPLLSGDFDNGVLLLDRFNHGNLWYEYAKLPDYGPEGIQTVVVESHWANWLAYDDHLQPELNQKWIDYLRNIQADRDHYLSKNTEQLYSQWLYKKHTNVRETSRGRVTIDNRSMPNDAYQYNLLGNMVLAVELRDGEHVSHASLDGKPIASYYEAEGYGYIYLPPLERKNYRFEYRTGNQPMNKYVNNTGTYNVYNVVDQGSSFEIDIQMYGEQIVQVRSPRPVSIDSTNTNLKVKSFTYNQNTSMTSIIVEGRDIQGERGKIILNFKK
jgi:hypothetical protein